MSMFKQTPSPELRQALLDHHLPIDKPSQISDAFRIGWQAALSTMDRVGIVDETWAQWPDKGNVVVVDWIKDTPPIGSSVFVAKTR